MPTQRRSNATVLEFSRGNGHTALGVVFLATGAALLCWAAINGNAERVPWPVVAPGVVFTLIGVVITWGRKGIKIDKTRRLATTWYGILVPFFSRQRAFAEFEHVLVVKETRRYGDGDSYRPGKGSAYHVYVVRLVGATTIQLDETTDAHDARMSGEQVAKFLDTALHDATSGATIIRERGTLDESLRARCLRTGEWPVIPDVPVAKTLDLHHEAQALRVRLPGIPLFGVIVLVFGPAGILAAVAHFVLSKAWADSGMAGSLVVVAVGGGAAILCYYKLAIGHLGTVLQANAEQLRVERKSMLGSQVTVLAASAVERVSVGWVEVKFAPDGQPEESEDDGPRARLSHQPLVIYSDDARLELGLGAPVDELRYVAAMLVTVLAGREIKPGNAKRVY